MSRPSNAKLEQDLLREVRDCFTKGTSGNESTNRELALEDIRFVDEEGAQWDQATRDARAGRPSYTFDRTSIAIDQVKGDQRQNTPQIKVIPADNKSDRKVADIYEGLIRAIEANSSASTAYNTGFDFALKGGYGAWRVYPKYVENSFDQELCVGCIENPFTVVFDPSAKDFMKRDAWWGIVSERVGRPQFEAEHPDLDFSSIDLSKNDSDWLTNDEVRVAEFYKRIRREKTLALLDDGRIIDYDTIKAIEKELENPPEGSGIKPIKVIRKRKSDETFIRWWKVYGGGVLEGPIDYDWKYIPLVPVYGRISNIEGKRKYRGLVRKAKDPQKAYNHARTSEVEAVAMVPRSPYFVTPAQVKGFENQWRTANTTNPLFLYYNPVKDLANGGKPSREPMPEIPQALIAMSAQAADDIKAATGKFGPSLGEPTNGELPGTIRQRNTEGDVSSYEFMSNFKESLRFTGELFVDMIPKVYDGQREIVTLGIDGKEDYVEINKQERDGVQNDLSLGRYKVRVDLGPAYTTQRQQAADYLMKLVGGSERLQALLGDLIAKNIDFEGADEMERRLRIPLIKDGTISPKDLTDEEKEMLASMPQQQPDPTQQALLMKLSADAERSKAQAQKAGVDAQSAIIDAQMKPAQLEKLIQETIGVRLENMLKAGEVGIDPSTGRMTLMKHLMGKVA